MDTPLNGDNLMEQVAVGRAKARTNVERWSPNVLVLAVSLLIVTNFLIYAEVRMAIVGAVAVSGLVHSLDDGLVAGKATLQTGLP